jgi:D-tyrosyl-tRNA(Tyr) deacylase
MRAVIQRVSRAAVSVKGQQIAKIGRGLLVLLGVMQRDTPDDASQLADKLRNLRIFADSANKMNLSIEQVQGEILVISQFTLCADLSRGRRPSFEPAASTKKAKNLYQEFIEQLKTPMLKVETGEFGEYMLVELINDGPVTFTLESR